FSDMAGLDWDTFFGFMSGPGNQPDAFTDILEPMRQELAEFGKLSDAHIQQLRDIVEFREIHHSSVRLAAEELLQYAEGLELLSSAEGRAAVALGQRTAEIILNALSTEEVADRSRVYEENVRSLNRALE